MIRKLKTEEMQRLSAGAFKLADKIPIVLVLDNIRSMMNTGSVFRTSDAFRVEKIVLCGITAQPPHREISRTALGATESVSWDYAEDTADAIFMLINQGYSVWALEQAEGSINLQDFRPDVHTKYAFVFGNEVNGVDQKALSLCQGCIEIPQFGTKHSMNVAVTAGILLWDVSCKMGAFTQIETKS